MAHVVRDLLLTEGKNEFHFSAEHRIIGVHRDATGSMFVTVEENTAVSDTQEGLVGRNVYVSFVGEVLPFAAKNVIETFLLNGDIRWRTMAVFVLPGIVK